MTLDMAISTLRPGLLVSFKTSVRGNVSYEKKMLETGRKLTRWETKREMEDPAEHARAVKTRSQVRIMIRRVCAVSAFGLLCPEQKEKDLQAAVREARALTAEFNRKSKFTRIEFYVFCGKVASDDVEAVRAINSEVRDLLADMQTGLKNLDIKAVREAAIKARSLGKMLTPKAEAQVRDAIDAARASANKISKAGEQAAAEIDRNTIKALSQARTAFLDLETFEQVARPSEKGRAIDLTPETKVARSKEKARALDI